MSALKPALRWIGIAMLWLVIALCLAVTIVPRYLDRIYYRGAISGHFDGERFFNPTGPDTSRPPTGGSRAGFFARIIRPDDRPVWPETVAIRQARPDELMSAPYNPLVYAPATPEEEAETPMRVTWVGHASVLVQTPRFNILTDPIWSDHAGPFGIGPKRIARPGIAFDDLPHIDLILISHNHYDHLDLATLKRLWQRDRPTIVTSLGNDAIMRSAGIEARALDWGSTLTVAERAGVSWSRFSRAPVRVIVNRNHHWGSRWFSDRNRALWSSFIVTLPGGNLFFAGDTGAGDYKWADQAASYGPIRLAILPIGAFRFQEGQMDTASHIGPGGAIKLWSRMGRPVTLPIHWGTFRLTWEGYWTPPRMLRALQDCAGERSGRFVPRSLGEVFDVPPLSAMPRSSASVSAKVRRCLSDPRVTALR